MTLKYNKAQRAAIYQEKRIAVRAEQDTKVRICARMLRAGYAMMERYVQKLESSKVAYIDPNTSMYRYVFYAENHSWGESGHVELFLGEDGSLQAQLRVSLDHLRLAFKLADYDQFEVIFELASAALLGSMVELKALGYDEGTRTVIYEFK